MSRLDRYSSGPELRGLEPKLKYVIGMRIRYLINRENDVRTHLAAKLGVTPGALYQWETGRTAPTVRNLTKLAREYEVPLDYLMCGEFSGLSPDQLAGLPIQLVARPPLSANSEKERSGAAGAIA